MKIYFPNDWKHYYEQSISYRDYKHSKTIMRSANNNKKLYLGNTKRHIKSVFEESILSIVEESKEWELDAHGLNLPGKEAEEMLHHSGWARNKCLDFVGRTELIDQCLRAIQCPRWGWGQGICS